MNYFARAIFLTILSVTASVAQAIPAFPGAQGFGANAVGGRGGEVYHVTNLNDAGPGSLRDAVSKSHRTVVFDVSGIISLKSPLSVKNNLTVAGQSAPGEGITLYGGINQPGRSDYKGGRVSFSNANDAIVRGLRIRGGCYSDKNDAAGIARGHDMIFDHLSVSWGRDETFSMNGDVSNITLQNCIIAQGLEPHSAGGLIQANGVSILRCLYADNHTRNPKVKGVNQFANNVIYNWEAGAYIEGDSAGDSFANVQNNYFIAGPLKASAPFTRANEHFHLFADGNKYDGNRDGKLNGALLAQKDYGPVSWQEKPHAQPELNLLNAEDAFAFVLQNAGASRVRDGVDKRLIEEVQSLGTKGQIMRHEFDAPMKDLFLIPETRRAADFDTDGDGMADEWERAYGLNPRDAEDRNGDFDKTGYTNLEKYLNSLLDGPYPLPRAAIKG